MNQEKLLLAFIYHIICKISGQVGLYFLNDFYTKFDGMLRYRYNSTMENKLIRLILFSAIIMVISCSSAPQTNDTPPQTPPPQPQVQEALAPEPAPVKETVFDPQNVSQELFNTTKAEVQLFIEKLNNIIRSKDYNAWRGSLSNEYFSEISSAENLHHISEQPAMKTRQIVLKTAEDYFNNVVVPSRLNSRIDDPVDDIEFIGQNRVKAFTIKTNRDGHEQRLRLYDLEKTQNIWRIIN